MFAANIYDIHVKLTITNIEWEMEIREFLENHKFPTIGAWDGFHVQVSSKLKSYHSFLKKYTVNNRTC